MKTCKNTFLVPLNMYIHKRTLPILLLTLLMILGCKKETQYVYEVNKVKAGSPASTKPNRKTTLEFVSILYSDILNTGIPQNELVRMITAYDAFGDARVVEDLIVRNLLNRTAAAIPSNEEMRADPEAFVRAMYKRFMVREPGAYEVWYFTDKIQKNLSIRPDQVYYALLTSDEYRYY
jgi:hypothetical protein